MPISIICIIHVLRIVHTVHIVTCRDKSHVSKCTWGIRVRIYIYTHAHLYTYMHIYTYIHVYICFFGFVRTNRRPSQARFSLAVPYMSYLGLGNWQGDCCSTRTCLEPEFEAQALLYPNWKAHLHKIPTRGPLKKAPSASIAFKSLQGLRTKRLHVVL